MRRMYDENQIKEIAGAASGGKIYMHRLAITVENGPTQFFWLYSSKATKLSLVDITALTGLSATNIFPVAIDGGDAGHAYFASTSKIYASASSKTYDITDADVADSIKEL